VIRDDVARRVNDRHDTRQRERFVRLEVQDWRQSARERDRGVGDGQGTGDR